MTRRTLFKTLFGAVAAWMAPKPKVALPRDTFWDFNPLDYAGKWKINPEWENAPGRFAGLEPGCYKRVDFGPWGNVPQTGSTLPTR